MASPPSASATFRMDPFGEKAPPTEQPFPSSSLLMMYSRMRALHPQVPPSPQGCFPIPPLLAPPPQLYDHVPLRASSHPHQLKSQPAEVAAMPSPGPEATAAQVLISPTGKQLDLSGDGFAPSPGPSGIPLSSAWSSSQPQLQLPQHHYHQQQRQHHLAMPLLQADPFRNASEGPSVFYYQQQQHPTLFHCYSAPEQWPAGSSGVPPLPSPLAPPTQNLQYGVGSGEIDVISTLPQSRSSSGVPEPQTPQQLSGSSPSAPDSATESAASLQAGGSRAGKGTSGCSVFQEHPGKRTRMRDDSGEEEGKGELPVERKMKRLMSNRASAKRSRQRKQDRLQELEVLSARLRVEHSEMQRQLNEAKCKLSKVEAQNQELRDKFKDLKGRNQEGASQEEGRFLEGSQDDKACTSGQEQLDLEGPAVKETDSLVAVLWADMNEDPRESESDDEKQDCFEDDEELVESRTCFEDSHFFQLP